MNHETPTPKQRESKSASDAPRQPKKAADDASESKKPLFRIVPVDPKNTLNFEDMAD